MTDPWSRPERLSAPLLCLALVLAGCTSPQEVRDESGGDGSNSGGDGNGQQGAVGDLVLPPGVTGESLRSGLSLPTSITWDDTGVAYVALSGFVYGGEGGLPAQVLRLEPDGGSTVVAEGFAPPVTDITWHEGRLYVSERGSVVALDPKDGWRKHPVLTDLPSHGDHHNNEIVFGPDGRLYVLQGTATNSAVVGLDNAQTGFGWTRNLTGFSDIPCEPVRVTGVNYETANPFLASRDLNAFEEAMRDVQVRYFNRSEDVPASAHGTSGDRVVTGPYRPLGTPTYRGETIEGNVRCTGALLSANPDGSDLRVVAWGFRNPFAMKFGPDGALYVAVNGYDSRGSRPMGATPDEFWRIEIGSGDTKPTWYGWPDYSIGKPITDPFFSPLLGPRPVKVLMEDPNEPPRPFTWSAAHASADKFTFAPSQSALAGDMLVAEYGTLNIEFTRGAGAGMAITRVHQDTGRVTEFIHHKDRWGGDFRPVEAAFGPDGQLYVVDVGPLVVKQQGNDGSYTNEFSPSTGRVLRFKLPDRLDWEGSPVGNVGGDGTRTVNMTQGNAPQEAVQVSVYDYGFTTTGEKIPVGRAVAFRNHGMVGHTATEHHGQFNTGFALAPGTTLVWTPEQAGTFHVYCAVHPAMRMTLEVTASTAST